MRALVPAVGAAVVAFLLVVWATFPFENSEPMTSSEETFFALLLHAAVAASVLALGSAYWIAHDRIGRARASSVLHVAIAVPFLVWALAESQDSDHVILGFGLGIELVGGFSMLLLVGHDRYQELAR